MKKQRTTKKKQSRNDPNNTTNVAVVVEDTGTTNLSGILEEDNGGEHSSMGEDSITHTLDNGSMNSNNDSALSSSDESIHGDMNQHNYVIN